MTTFTEEYLQQLIKKHNEDPHYGRSGAGYADKVVKMVEEFGINSILDYGCGKGDLLKAVSKKVKVDVMNYDPAMKKFEQFPIGDGYELVTCTDVLEHIEPECLLEVVTDISELATKLAFFVIHTGPAVHHLPDGRNAHLIQKPIDWWIDVLEAFFHTSEPIAHGDKVTYEVLCMPKDYEMEQYDKAYALIEDLLAPEVSEVVTKSTVKFNLWGFR